MYRVYLKCTITKANTIFPSNNYSIKQTTFIRVCISCLAQLACFYQPFKLRAAFAGRRLNQANEFTSIGLTLQSET